MTFNIGLNIVEVDGTGAPAVPGAATSVAAFNILTRRGPAQKAVRVGSFAEFEKRFGSHFTQGLGSYLVKGFFDNDGATAYVNRVVATGGGASTTARRVLLDSGPAKPPPSSAMLPVEVSRSWLPPSSDASTSLVPALIAARISARVAAAGLANCAALKGMVVAPAASSTVTTRLGKPAATMSVATGSAPAVTTVAAIVSASRRPETSERRVVLTKIPRPQDPGSATPCEPASSVRVFTRLAVAANATLGFAAPANADATTAVLGASSATLQSISGLNVGDAIAFDDGTPPASERAKIMTINPVTRAVTWPG